MKGITEKIGRLFAKKAEKPAPQFKNPYIKAAEDLADFIGSSLAITQIPDNRIKVTFGPECALGYPDDIANNHRPDIIPCGCGSTKEEALQDLGKITVENMHKGQALFVQKGNIIHIYSIRNGGVEHTYSSTPQGKYEPLPTELIPA